jgi:hypothetical protein
MTAYALPGDLISEIFTRLAELESDVCLLRGTLAAHGITVLEPTRPRPTLTIVRPPKS